MSAARSGVWSAIRHFDAARLAPAMALRNAIGIAIPLAVGIAAQNPSAGVMAATGALDVAFSDGEDPYAHRARRMLAAGVLVAIAVFAGRAVGHNHAAAIVLGALCAIAAGLMVAIGQTPADIGTITLVTLIVFSASPAPFGKALSSGLLALGGGVLQTLISLALWPVKRYAPESAVVANLYRELARGASAGAPATEAPPATAAISAARDTLAALTGDRTVEAERYLALFSQAERIRLTLLVLWRIRTRLRREESGIEEAGRLEASLAIAADVLRRIAEALENQETFRTRALASLSPVFPKVSGDAKWQLDALAGQLRSAVELADHTTHGGRAEFARQESKQPWTLRVAGGWAVVRANLCLRSAAMRHALRLAACVALADLLARSMGWHRPYWAPMTVAIVLKPDFTATYSRGVLRLAGTFAGLALSTVIVHMLSPTPLAQAALITLFLFLMRWAGGTNYGVLVTALTGLVVFLFSLTGVSPGEVMTARALNTLAGGAIALTAYRLWPTWERTRIPESLAELFDAYRHYFQSVRDAYLEPERRAELEQARQAGRLARTNLEASVARFASEPGTDAERLTVIERILANSHRYIHAVMALEAGLQRSSYAPARPAFREFANAVDATLYFLAAYLRGSAVEAGDLPDLRTLHEKLMHSGAEGVERYALVNVEADRIVNSLNSLAMEVVQFVGLHQRGSPRQ
jgi:uncharacterized membrane protein YccC